MKSMLKWCSLVPMYFQLIYTPIWIPFHKYKVYQGVGWSNDGPPCSSTLKYEDEEEENEQWQFLLDLKLHSNHFKTDMHISTSNNIINSWKYNGTLYWYQRKLSCHWTAKLYAWYSYIIVITRDPWTESLQNRQFHVGFQTQIIKTSTEFKRLQKLFSRLVKMVLTNSTRINPWPYREAIPNAT